jgi:diguanylate cyclase (GGDEF)-like protein
MTLLPPPRDAAAELRGLVHTGKSLRRHPVLFLLVGTFIQVLATVPVSLAEPQRDLGLLTGSIIMLVAVLGGVLGGALSGVVFSLVGSAAYVLLAHTSWHDAQFPYRFAPLGIGLVLAMAAGLIADALRRRTERALGYASAREREIRRTLAEVAAARREIQELALHDELTGLPNRRLFNDRFAVAMAQAHRKEDVLAVLFVDCDNFKAVNDVLGHHGGDVFLRRLSLRMKTCLREGDTLARVGGDEFCLLLPGIGRHEEAELVAARVLAQFRRPFDIHGHQVAGSASIGIAAYPRDGCDQSTLLFAADQAMYRVKQGGRSGYASGADGIEMQADRGEELVSAAADRAQRPPRRRRVRDRGDDDQGRRDA